jgi:hypothetical protein
MYFDAVPDGDTVPVLGQTAAWGAALASTAVVAVGVVAEPLLAALDGARLLP